MKVFGEFILSVFNISKIFLSIMVVVIIIRIEIEIKEKVELKMWFNGNFKLFMYINVLKFIVCLMCIKSYMFRFMVCVLIWFLWVIER